MTESPRTESNAPRWFLLTVIGPLIFLVIVNGVGTYYGQMSLHSAVSELKKTVSNMPTKQDIKSSNNFLTYRIQSVERHQQLQDQRIRANHDAIMLEQGKKKSDWQIPYRRPPSDSMKLLNMLWSSVSKNSPRNSLINQTRHQSFSLITPEPDLLWH